jgi:hypothetical protein
VRCQAKEELAPAKDAVQGTGLGTIIVYRLWSFSGAGRTSWKTSVDNGPDLIVRNGTYLGLDVALGDHVLDHKHEFLFGSDPQTVHVKAGETVYFQYFGAASLVFEVADDQAQAARMVAK